MDPQILQDLCPQSQQTPLLAFAWIFLGAAGLITALRLYSKSKQLGGITADDYAALASTILAATAVSFLTVWIHFGLGRHALCLENPQLTLLWSFICQVLNIVGVCLIKISVCICILRALDSEPRLLRSSIWILLIFVGASHATQTVLLFLQCRPLDAIWNTSIQDSRCFTPQQLSLVYYIGYASDTLTVFICASTPLAITCRLHLSHRARIGLCVLMGSGVLIAGCAIAKTITIPGVWNVDFTWETATPMWFTIAQFHGSIVLACIPCLTGLLAPSARSNPSLYSVEGAEYGSLYSSSRKGSFWNMGTQRIPIPGTAKKHLSISTFGMSEGEFGSRLTLVENRLTVVGEDEDRLTRVAEEGNSEPQRSAFETRSVRRATLEGGNNRWNQDNVFGLGILGKDAILAREENIRPRANTSASSIYSVGRVTRPSTPKRMTISTQPMTPKSTSRRPSRPATPGTPRRPQSTTSSTYSDPLTGAGFATIPTPPASARDPPPIITALAWRPITPTTPKTPTWTVSPSDFTMVKSSKTPTYHSLSTPTEPRLRTPKGSSTPKGGSRPGTPKQSISTAVPVSKFRAEVLEAVATKAKKVESSPGLAKNTEHS